MPNSKAIFHCINVAKMFDHPRSPFATYMSHAAESVVPKILAFTVNYKVPRAPIVVIEPVVESDAKLITRIAVVPLCSNHIITDLKRSHTHPFLAIAMSRRVMARLANPSAA